MRRNIIPISAIILSLMLAACQVKQAGDLRVSGAWARPGLAGGNSAVYFTIENQTAMDDFLKSADSRVGKAVEIHQSMMDENGVMSMSPQESVPVPAGEKVEFAPGGTHVMLIDLQQDLKVNDTFSMTLTLEKGGEVKIEVQAREP